MTKRTPRSHTFNGQKYKISQADMNSGSQGSVSKAYREDDKSQQAIIKAITNDPATLKRTQYLVDSGIGYELPFVSAPLALRQSVKKDQLFYLSTFVEGVSLEDAPARSLPERLMSAYLAVSLWAEFESKNFAHGDISFNNLMTAPDGSINIIDVDNFNVDDPSVPKPTMYGQHPIMAPELRNSERKNKPPSIDLLTDRYAWAVTLSYLLLERHPASWVKGGPLKFDKAMSQGFWPENKRSRKTDQPIKSLGLKLPKLFDQGFSLSPLQRPDADAWKRELGKSLNALYVHECGLPFIYDPSRKTCLKCRKHLPPMILKPFTDTSLPTLSLEHLPSCKSVKFALPEGKFIFLGRDNLPNASGYVSQKHLQIFRQENTLYISHIGSNPSTIELASANQVFKLNELKECLENGRLENAIFTLGDSRYRVMSSQK